MKPPVLLVAPVAVARRITEALGEAFSVDKAKAVMASDADGVIYYFARTDTLNRYRAR
jgi:hypothetical protein